MREGIGRALLHEEITPSISRTERKENGANVCPHDRPADSPVERELTWLASCESTERMAD